MAVIEAVPSASVAACAPSYGTFCESDVLPIRPARLQAPTNGVHAAKIMIVDDEPVNVKVVRKYLQGFGYENFVTETDSLRTMEQVRREQPDVLVLDIMMPRLSGLEILAALQADERLYRIPVIVLTASADAQTKVKALELGATDFLAKPVDPNELAPRIRNAVTVKAHQDHLIRYSEQLEEKVRQRTAQLIASRRQVILCLARAAEYRDNETGRHVIRVGCYAAVVARHLSMPEHEVELLEQAAQLHDVGKIGVPDSILLKPGKLDPDEFANMQKHCGFGRRIIEPMNNTEFQILRRHTELGASIMDVPGSPVLTKAARIAQTHHERWDGSGYPLGLAGEHIPIEGRITAVADVFDGLSTKRPYKPAFPLEKCFGIMKEGRGTHFDPRVLDAFFAGQDEIIRLQIEYADLD